MFGSDKSLLIVIALAIFFSFWKLGARDLNEWDESQYGQNAFEMMHNGDYVHYYYAGNPDTWNAKPPLSVWLIIVAYKIFGYNAFALRFFSAVAAVLFFVFAFKLARLYTNERFAFITCLILITSKAIIGFHVGRTGDSDALLVLFLTASLYYFLLWIDFEKRNAIYTSAIFLGLAFYVKGPAAFLLLPGLLIYLIATGKFQIAIKKKHLWFAAGVAITIMFSWIAILWVSGQKYKGDSFYGSGSVLETLFFHDTVNRLTDAGFREAQVDRMFFIRYLDVRLNIWNYFFYLSLLLGIAALIRKRKFMDRILILSLCLLTSMALLFTFAASKHDWYLAPVALFMAIIITKGFTAACEKYKWFNAVFMAVLLFTAYTQFNHFNKPKRESILFFEKNKNQMNKTSSIQLIQMPSQDYFLYLNWYANQVLLPAHSLPQKSSLIFIDKRFDAKEPFKIVDCSGNYCLALNDIIVQ
jgi:4-amino-4-deoxy-L-arabinose transferase-like glycosyltransferase